MEESTFAFGEVDDDDSPGVWIIEERPRPQEGKIFVDYGERATIAEHLERRHLRADREDHDRSRAIGFDELSTFLGVDHPLRDKTL